MATRLGTGDTVDGGNYLYIDATTISQNTSTRQSTVTWHAYWHFSTVGCRDLGNLQFTVNGAKEYTGSTASNAEHTYNSSHTAATHPNLDMASGSFVIQHDGNGIGSFTCSGTCTGYSGAVSNFATHTVTLAEISTVPDAPGLTSVSQVNNLNALDIVYTAPADDGGPNIDNYIIQYANNSSFSGYTNVNDTGGTYRISNLAWGQAYWVRVYAHNSIGNSGPSTVRSGTTDSTIPSTMAAPTISAITYNSANVGYTAPAANGAAILDYYVRVWKDAALTQVQSEWSPASNPQTVTGLAPNTSYWVGVYARNVNGYSNVSPVSTFKTGVTVPGAPTGLAISNITPVAASGSWAAPAFTGGQTITGYDVSITTTNAVGAITASPTASPYPITGLKPSTDYWFWVRAKNASGVGTWSASQQFKTLPGAWIGNGTEWRPAIVYVGNGTAWVPATIHVGDGTAWK